MKIKKKLTGFSSIDSNQQSATVTFVRVSGNGAGQDDNTPENMPLDALDLNPEGSGENTLEIFHDFLKENSFNLKIDFTEKIKMKWDFFSVVNQFHEKILTTNSFFKIDIGDPKANPILMLDQDQINRLENVLSSDEAKSFLGEALANPDNNLNQSLGDILTSSGGGQTNPEFALIGPPPPLMPNSEVLNNR